jgi:hypothetical protein
MMRYNRRRTRLITRLSFAAVLLMAFVGWWYATNYWVFDLEDLYALVPAEDGTWIDTLSAMGEEAIQLFIGIAGGS